MFVFAPEGPVSLAVGVSPRAFHPQRSPSPVGAKDLRGVSPFQGFGRLPGSFVRGLTPTAINTSPCGAKTRNSNTMSILRHDSLKTANPC